MWERVKEWLGKPAQLAAAVWKRILWFLGKPTVAWIICGALAVLVFFGLRYLHLQSTDNDINANSIRNYIFGIGGVGALLGVWLASIRNKDFSKQVDAQTEQSRAQTEQVKLQRQQTRSETLSRCVEQIGNKDSAVIRIAGMHGLEILAQDHQTDTQLLKYICSTLQGFIDKHAPSRHSGVLYKLSQLSDWQRSQELKGVLTKERLEALEEWRESWRNSKVEVEQAIHSFGCIVSIVPKILRGPDLSSRYLPELHISKSEIGELYLRRANLFLSFLPDANLWSPDLRGTHFLNTNLKGADFIMAKMQKTRFCKTELENADFSGAKLAGAIYYENEDEFIKDLERESSELGIPITRENEWLKKQGVKNWEKAVYSDDPEE